MKKRLLVLSDMHCGHLVGLTHPGDNPRYDDERKIVSEYRDFLWEWFEKEVKALGKIDVVVHNGDALDGKGKKSGGTEQIEMDRNSQAEMAANILGRIRTKETRLTYGCLTPGHRILTADLRWVPVETLVPGDRVMGFDESPRTRSRRRLIYSTIVTHNIPMTKFVYKLSLSDGTSLVASEDHPFLARRGNAYHWWTVKRMYDWLYFKDGKRKNRPPIWFPRMAPTWETLDGYDAGYLAGFFDGEGSLNQSTKERRNDWPEHVFAIHGYQNENAMLETVREYMDNLGFNYSVLHRDRSNKMVKIVGGRWEGMRLLGSLRPKRLLEKFNPDIVGTLKNPYDVDVHIEAIEPIGMKEVCGLSTESQTYISEGFLSHNTGYHTGTLEDYEDVVATKLSCPLPSGTLDLEINGVVFNFKHKVGGSQIPHGRATAQLRDKLWAKQWAARGEYPDCDVQIRSHNHYFGFGGDSEFLWVATPALQGYGWNKYGTRIMSGTVDYGFVHFDISAKGEYSWEEHTLRMPHQPPETL